MGDTFDFDSLEQSCVLVITEYGDGQTSVGTGNIIYNDGFRMLVLTCGHNVEDYFVKEKQVTFRVKVWDAVVEERLPLAFLVSTEAHARQEELGLLKAVLVGKNYNELKLTEPVMKKGMPLYMSSHLFANKLVSNTSGILSQLAVPGDNLNLKIRSFVEYSIEGGKGSSGAAVVDSLGQLVAVHVNAGMREVDYDKQFKDPVDNYVLETPSLIRYGIPRSEVLRMICMLSDSLPPETTTLEERLCHIAILAPLSPSSDSSHPHPEPNKEEESPAEKKLRREHVVIACKTTKEYGGSVEQLEKCISGFVVHWEKISRLWYWYMKTCSRPSPRLYERQLIGIETV